ncbi:TonB-dependent receptor [Sphingobacterium spiritivorum]|uniref:TonB-dependent receptor n=1 Tax=Sphingobacterium spiritivorum TaxID=258 RepID=UPI003DA575DD
MKVLIFLLFMQTAVFAQTQITGRITDKSNRPVPRASIYLVGTYDGTTSDSSGNFSFRTTETGTKELKVTAIGYQNALLPIQTVQTSFLQIQLAEAALQLDEIAISAGMLQAGDKAKGSVMTPLEIVTTAGSMGNIIAGLATLPGAQVAGESGRLMVRGGSSSETSTYVNGIQASQPYTSAPNDSPVRGRFSPFLFKGINLSTGGYSAEYGNALSGVLLLNTADKIEDPKTELSLSSVGVGLGTTQAWKKNSLSFNGSYSNLRPYVKLINQQLDWIDPYQSGSGEMIYRHQSSNSFLNIYGSFNIERFSLRQQHIDYTEPVYVKRKTDNIYLNINYKQKLSRDWRMESGIGADRKIDNTYFNESYIPDQDFSLHIKEKLSKTWNQRLRTSFGGDFFYTRYKERYTDPERSFAYGYTSQIGAFYAETDYAFSTKWITKLGLRASQTNMQDGVILEPRVSLGYLINRSSQLSLAYGDFHQQADPDILKYANRLDWMSSRHFILNYMYENKGRTVRIEAYRKTYDQLVQYNTARPTYQSVYSNGGKGFAEGIDILYRDNTSIRNLQYWVSYSYTHTRRQEANYPMEVTPSYVADHALSVVSKYWISDLKSQLSLTGSYVSGRPYNDQNSADFMQQKTKGYSQVAMSWSYLLSQQKILFFSVTNLLGNKPVYGYNYASQSGPQGVFARQAITPVAKRFVFVGFFMTISRNKKDNQLDNL